MTLKHILQRASIYIRIIGYIIRSWPLIALILFLIPSTGPHMTIMNGRDQYGRYEPCVYLGSRGFVQAIDIYDCPFLIILNGSTGETP